MEIETLTWCDSWKNASGNIYMTMAKVTNMVRYTISRSGQGVYIDPPYGREIGPFDTVEDAKLAAQGHYASSVEQRYIPVQGWRFNKVDGCWEKTEEDKQ